MADDQKENAPAKKEGAEEPNAKENDTGAPEEVTKASIRKGIWDHMEKENIALFPRPVYNRIPNYEGAIEANNKLPAMEIFQKAQVVKVNPDKPQQQARFLTLEGHKDLLVPTPRLRSGLFNKIVPPANFNKETLRFCSTSRGLTRFGKRLGLDTNMNIDVIVLGSSAVSKEGYRLGKGEGFAELEYAMMKSIGAVNDDTPIITTVHDCQITDIPADLMQPYDLSVDYIVTPTQTIQCPKRSRPQGIIWSLLPVEKLYRMPILKELREKEREAGKDVTLKDGQEPDPEKEKEMENSYRDRYRESEGGENGERVSHEDGDRPPRRQRRNFKPRKPRYRRGTDRDEQQGDGDADDRRSSEQEGDHEGDRDDDDRRKGKPRRWRRYPRRKRVSRGGSESKEEREDDEEEDEKGDRNNRENGPRYRRPFRPRRNPLPALYVGNLPRGLRVSEFKAQVREKNVNPLRFVWKSGARSFSLLLFEQQEELDSALESLKNLTINDRELKVEVSKRRQRQQSSAENDDGGDEGGDDGNRGAAEQSVQNHEG